MMVFFFISRCKLNLVSGGGVHAQFYQSTRDWLKFYSHPSNLPFFHFTKMLLDFFFVPGGTPGPPFFVRGEP